MYFISLSIITIIVLYISIIIRSLDFSNLVIKSIIILFYNIFNIDTNYIFLYSLYLTDLFY